MVKRAREQVCHSTLATCVSQGKTASATIANNSKPSWTSFRSAEARLTWTLPVARNQSSRLQGPGRVAEAAHPGGQWSMVNGQTARAIVEFFTVLLNTSISFVPGNPFGGLVSRPTPPPVKWRRTASSLDLLESWRVLPAPLAVIRPRRP